MFESMDIAMVERILRDLPVNIFFKDKDCKYVFSSHIWHHIKRDNTKDWDIKGKSSADVRLDGLKEANHSYDQDRKILETGEPISYVTAVETNGIKEYIEVVKYPVRDDNGAIIGIVGMVTDVTQKRKMEEQLEIYARTDTLTGLYNRRYLEYWLNEKLSKDLCPVGIISADCDGLKNINDTFGHHVGDELIRNSSSVFRVCMPPESVIFRMGGDEFLIVVPKTEMKRLEEYVAQMDKAAQNMKVQGQALSISFGCAVYDETQSSFEECINRADKRMYENKRSKKNAIVDKQKTVH